MTLSGLKKAQLVVRFNKQDEQHSLQVVVRSEKEKGREISDAGRIVAANCPQAKHARTNMSY